MQCYPETSHVVKVAIDAGPSVYVLHLDNNHLSALRSKSARGVTLKSEPMEVPQWLEALNVDIQLLAERTGQAHGALHDFLMS